MRYGWNVVSKAAAVPFVIALTFVSEPGRGDEPSRLGRLFRFGGGSATLKSNESKPPSGLPTTATSAPSPEFSSPSLITGPTSTKPTPVGSTRDAGSASPRLVPQPRVNRAVTEADPLVTRVTLGRADGGSQFGMFLQVYADGTVIDSEGVHPLGRETIKPLLEALESSELHRVRSHCGGPPTDFIEQVQVVVYERSLGRLRANAFSFSGNTQNCDHAVRHLQTTLDAIQAKLSRPGSSAIPSGPAIGPDTSPAPPIRLNEDPFGPSKP